MIVDLFRQLRCHCLGAFHRSYFPQRVTVVKFSPTAEEFTTAVFASSTCSHRSRKLILCGGHSATFSVFSIYFGPNNNSLTQLYTHLMVHATTRTETGLEWELIVQYAAYMQRSIVWADRLELANWATNRIYGVLHWRPTVIRW